MPTHKPLPPLDILRAILRYNPHTGAFLRYRKTKKEWVKLNPTRAISIKGSPYMAHRLAFYMHTGRDPGELMLARAIRASTSLRQATTRCRSVALRVEGRLASRDPAMAGIARRGTCSPRGA
jgi:hypothetical protein